MITTKAGIPIKIVSGSKKSITGKKHFVCEYILTTEDMIRKAMSGIPVTSMTGRFKLTKHEMLFDSESELYDALNLVKE